VLIAHRSSDCIALRLLRHAGTCAPNCKNTLTLYNACSAAREKMTSDLVKEQFHETGIDKKMWVINKYSIPLFVTVSLSSSKMRFTLLSSSEMQRLSHVHVVNKALYLQDNSREPAVFGVLDRRMVSVI